MYDKVARINAYNLTDEEYKKIKAEITHDIKTNNIKVYDSSIESFVDFRGWGNYCLPNIPYVKAIEYAEKYDLTVDLEKEIVLIDDINNLEVGQKVQFAIDSIFGMFLQKGTVHATTKDTVTVRLYRSKTKGVTMKVGSVGRIVTGW